MYVYAIICRQSDHLGFTSEVFQSKSSMGWPFNSCSALLTQSFGNLFLRLALALVLVLKFVNGLNFNLVNNNSIDGYRGYNKMI